MEYECGSSKRNSSVAPFSLFISFSLFTIFLYFCSLIDSFYLSLICTLWDLLTCPLWDLFLTYGRHSIFYKNIEDLHTLQEVLNIKKDENYHDVCKCMPLPV